MRTTKLASLFLLLITFSFFSCGEKSKSTEKKQEVDKNEQTVKQEEVKEKKLLEDYALKIDFTFETDQEGIFQIKYNAQDPKYTKLKNLTVKENMVNNPVTISSTFNLELYGIPKSVYLILGVKKQREVKVVGITITTDEEVIEVNKNNIQDYFILNQYTSYDNESGIIKTHNYKEKHVPLLTLNKRAFEILMLE